MQQAGGDAGGRRATAAARVAELIRRGWERETLSPEMLGIELTYRRTALVRELEGLAAQAERVRVVENYVREMEAVDSAVWGRREVDADAVSMRMTKAAEGE
jgi:hypothetical protein